MKRPELFTLKPLIDEIFISDAATHIDVYPTNIIRTSSLVKAFLVFDEKFIAELHYLLLNL